VREAPVLAATFVVRCGGPAAVGTGGVAFGAGGGAAVGAAAVGVDFWERRPWTAIGGVAWASNRPGRDAKDARAAA